MTAPLARQCMDCGAPGGASALSLIASGWRKVHAGAGSVPGDAGEWRCPRCWEAHKKALQPAASPATHGERSRAPSSLASAVAVASEPQFNLPEKCPFPYGSGPWRGRGQLHKVDLETALALVPGGPSELWRRIHDPELERYFRQEFSGSAFYDILPSLYLGRAVSRARGVGFDGFARHASAAHARGALTGFSGVVLRTLSPERVALWMPRISSWFHEFGTTETSLTDEGFVRALRRGVPQPLVRPLSGAAAIFLEEILGQRGAKNARMQIAHATQDGTDHGIPTFCLTCELRWQRE